MESEINSGSTGGGKGDGPPRLTQKEGQLSPLRFQHHQRGITMLTEYELLNFISRLLVQHKTLNAPVTGNEQERQSSTETDFAEGGSQSVGKKRRRENEDSPRAGDAENNDEAGPVTIDEETILWNDIQQRFVRLVNMVDQIIGVINTAEAAYLVDAYATIEEDISTLQEAIESFENAAIDDEETNTLLREARDALENFVTSLNMPDVS